MDKAAPARTSELCSKIWSVISFDELIATNLTYDEALERMAILRVENVAGLCIVTNAASTKLA
ncbi:MAG: hypothetical protein ACK5NT_08235 [Pyrinomonadaceae bacterium]